MSAHADPWRGARGPTELPPTDVEDLQRRLNAAVHLLQRVKNRKDVPERLRHDVAEALLRISVMRKKRAPQARHA